VKPDQDRMRRAMDDAVRALSPVIAEHGATLGLAASASALGLLLVGCHRMHATGCPLAEATALLAARFEQAVGQALQASVEVARHPGGRA
jgi:hypothetical protein